MKITSFLGDTKDWQDDNTFRKFVEPGDAVDDIRSNLIDRFQIDPERKYTPDVITVAKEAISTGLEFALNSFSELETTLEQAFVAPAKAEDDFLINELDGVCGFAWPDNVLLFFDPVAENWNSMLYFASIHEANHVIRLKYSDNTLLEWIVMEGLAEVFINEKFPERVPAKFVTESLSRVDEFIPKLKSFWNTPHEEIPDARDWIFGNSEKEIPKWLGYAAGYSLVSKVRENNLNEDWEQFIKRPATSFEL